MVLPKAGSGLSSDVEYCWGQDNGGQAGQVTTDQTDLPSPSIKTSVGLAIRKQGNFVMYYVSTLGNVSGEFACAVNGTALGQTSGALYCWGDDYYGELGNGTRSTGTQMYATPVSNLQSNVTDVATNNGRACALMSGTLYCWGENGTGGTTGGTVDYRLDSGPTFSSQNAVPTPQPLITSTSSPQYGATITDFAITDWDTCVVISGNVWCSGYNDLGQLGQGTVSGPARGTATSPSQVVSANNMVEVKGALAGQKVVQITSGNDHFCAITSTHASYCWGENDLGQLGNGSTVSSPAPTPVHIPATVIF